jgi:hypothetical protein
VRVILTRIMSRCSAGTPKMPEIGCGARRTGRIIAPRITQGAVMSRRGVTSVRLLGWSSESA